MGGKRRNREEEEEEVTVLKSYRKLVPTHFNFKIQSFSMLLKNSFVHLDSNEFEAGGYKWNLKVYPEGNIKENGRDHVSVYLVMADTSSLPACWEIKVDFRLFLFDQIRDKYLIRGEMGGGTSRFHEMKMKLGFAQFVSLDEFKDPSNGYLVDNTCVFGAEVFVYKRTGNGDCLSMIKKPVTAHYSWKVNKFSDIKVDYCCSQNFKADGRNWNILVFPKGEPYSRDSISLYLNLADDLAPGVRVCADFILRIRSQNSEKHHDYADEKYWFGRSGKLRRAGGWLNFIKLCDLNDQTKGFLVNDTCIIEAEVKVLGSSVGQLQ